MRRPVHGRTFSGLLDPSVLSSVLLLLAVVFNAILAIVNAHVAALSPSAVVAAELLIVCMAQILALSHLKPEMQPWFALAFLLVMAALLRSLFMQEIDLKYLRDVLLIQTFVVLGMLCSRTNLSRVVIALHALVVGIMLLEALDTDAYASLFGIQDYYINTRGYRPTDFWNTESELYVSATRPDERLMLPFLGLHRLSSIFLEPVSLGNYAVIITAFVCARFSSLGGWAKWFLILGNIAIIIGSDGRIALIASALIIAVTLIAPRLPRYSALLYLPAVVAAAFLLVHLGGFRAGGDDFTGRVALSVSLLSGFDVSEWLGVSSALDVLIVDSGLGYLISTQSLFGLILIWLFIVFAGAEKDAEQIRFKHALCLYLSLSMMVSFSVFSIKTAALLWFIYGALQNRRQEAPVPATQARGVRRAQIVRRGLSRPEAAGV